MTSATMIVLVSVPSAASDFRRLRISVPLVECLLDGRKYFLPDELPPLAGTDLRSIRAPRLDKIGRAIPERARGPRWTAHDRARSERRREQRDLKELAELLGDPV